MLKPSDFFKIRVAVPAIAAEAVKKAMAEAGAGRQGKYDFCFGTHPQTGQFRPLAGAHPAIGDFGKIEQVDEVLIETLCHQDKISSVIAAVRKVHPYEEPAIDVIQRFEID